MCTLRETIFSDGVGLGSGWWLTCCVNGLDVQSIVTLWHRLYEICRHISIGFVNASGHMRWVQLWYLIFRCGETCLCLLLPYLTKVTRVIETEPTITKVTRVIEGKPSVTKVTRVIQREPSVTKVTRVVTGTYFLNEYTMPIVLYMSYVWRTHENGCFQVPSTQSAPAPAT